MTTNRLHIRRLDSVGMVGKGDDPESGIVFWKRKPQEKGTMAFDPKKLEGEARTAWDALQKRADDAETNVTTITARVTDLEKQLPKKDDGVLKGISPEAKAEFDKQAADLKSARERIEKMEQAAEREHYIAKAAVLKHLPGAKPDDFATILQKCDRALDEKERETLAKLLSSWNEALRTSAMFKEFGSAGGEAEGSVEDEVAKAQADIMKRDPKLTKEQARARVWETRRDLFDRYQDEHAARLRQHNVEG